MKVKSKKLSKFDAQVLSIVAGSSVRVRHNIDPNTNRLRYLELDLRGPVSKLPSSANSRAISANKGHLIKRVNSVANVNDLNQLANSIQKFRPRSFVSLDYRASLEALTKLYHSRVAPNSLQFQADKSHRVFCLVLLGESCKNFDTHNMPKGICDWLQEVGIIENDKFLDCVAYMKRHLPLLTEETTTIIVLDNRYVQHAMKEFAEVFLKFPAIYPVTQL